MDKSYDPAKISRYVLRLAESLPLVEAEEVVWKLANAEGVKASCIMAGIRDAEVFTLGQGLAKREVVRWYSLRGERVTLVSNGERNQYGQV